MKAVWEKLRKICRSRGLWSVLGILGGLYLADGAVFGGSYTRELISKIYFDSFTPFFLAFVIVLILYIAGIEKDFFRGFYRAFAGKRKGVSRMELQRAVKAFGCAEKTAVTAGIIIIMFGVIDLISSIASDGFQRSGADIDFWQLSIPIGMLSCYVIYPSIFILILIPVKARLERMLISYMEAPEDDAAERSAADEQRLYFGLRAMGLTDREAEVARLAGNGMSNREIGQQLYITEATVKKHMTHILEKTMCADRKALAERIREL